MESMVQPGLKLDGRVAIVTGAGSSGPGIGTGKAISVLFAREGARVVLVDKYEERAKETLALIEDEGGEATIVTADLAETAACQQVVDEAVARFGTRRRPREQRRDRVIDGDPRHDTRALSAGGRGQPHRSVHVDEGGDPGHGSARVAVPS